MKFWIEAKRYEAIQGETLAETVERDMDARNLKFEVRGDDGKWKTVDEKYFEGK